MANHQHIKVLVDGVNREWTGRIGRGGQHVALPAHFYDVRRVSAAGTLRVVGMNRPSLKGGNRIFDETRLVERVGMYGDLYVVFVRYG